MTLEEITIIIMESALERTKEYEIRCARRMGAAQIELQEAMQNTRDKKQELEMARERYLRGAI